MKDVVGDLTWPEPRSLRNNRQPTRDDDTDCYTIGFFADGLLERWHPFGSSFVTTLYRLFFSPFFGLAFYSLCLDEISRDDLYRSFGYRAMVFYFRSYDRFVTGTLYALFFIGCHQPMASDSPFN